MMMMKVITKSRHQRATSSSHSPPPSPGVVLRADSLAAMEEMAANSLSVKGVIWDRGSNSDLENSLSTWLQGKRESHSRVWRVQEVTVGGNEGETCCRDFHCHDDEKDPALHAEPTHNHDAAEKIKAACSRLVSDLPSCARDVVSRDAEALAQMMLRFFQSEEAASSRKRKHRITMQIEFVGRNRCSRWHQDNYFGRALVTYVGDGTWLADDSSVQYDQFEATRGQPFGISDPKIVPRFEDVHRTPTNSVVLMKGNAWPKLRSCGYFRGHEGLTHKAPNVEERNRRHVQVRFLLKVDLAMVSSGLL